MINLPLFIKALKDGELWVALFDEAGSVVGDLGRQPFNPYMPTYEFHVTTEYVTVATVGLLNANGTPVAEQMIAYRTMHKGDRLTLCYKIECLNEGMAELYASYLAKLPPYLAPLMITTDKILASSITANKLVIPHEPVQKSEPEPEELAPPGVRRIIDL